MSLSEPLLATRADDLFSKSARYLHQLLKERKRGLHTLLISFRDQMCDLPRSDIS
jgi:hypothetical protein